MNRILGRAGAIVVAAASVAVGIAVPTTAAAAPNCVGRATIMSPHHAVAQCANGTAGYIQVKVQCRHPTVLWWSEPYYGPRVRSGLGDARRISVKHCPTYWNAVAAWPIVG
jgi:hypothetical protein